MAHTPGPWAQYDGGDPLIIVAKDGWSLGEMSAGAPQISLHEQIANARLTAAAPDMLAALKNIENDGLQVPDHAWRLIQHAIAKAEGAE